MATTTDPKNKAVTAFFTPETRNEIKAESAAAGMDFTSYILHLRKLAKSIAPKKKGRK